MTVFGIDEVGKGSVVAASGVESSRIGSPTAMTASVPAAHAKAAVGVVRDGIEGICDAGDVDAVRFARRVARTPS